MLGLIVLFCRVRLNFVDVFSCKNFNFIEFVELILMRNDCSRSKIFYENDF